MLIPKIFHLGKGGERVIFPSRWTCQKGFAFERGQKRRPQIFTFLSTELVLKMGCPIGNGALRSSRALRGARFGPKGGHGGKTLN